MRFIKGEKYVRRYTVRREHSASHVGSGEVEVLSTPSMILFIEETCRLHASKYLDEGQTTVGIHVDIYHVKPAPVGSEVTVEATLLNFDRKRLIYYAEVKYDDHLIGYGIHERYIVERSRFIEGVRK